MNYSWDPDIRIQGAEDRLEQDGPPADIQDAGGEGFAAQDLACDLLTITANLKWILHCETTPMSGCALRTLETYRVP